MHKRLRSVWTVFPPLHGLNISAIKEQQTIPAIHHHKGFVPGQKGAKKKPLKIIGNPAMEDPNGSR